MKPQAPVTSFGFQTIWLRSLGASRSSSVCGRSRAARSAVLAAAPITIMLVATQ